MKDTLIKAISQQGSQRIFALSGRLTATLALTLASVWPTTLTAEEVVNVYSNDSQQITVLVEHERTLVQLMHPPT